MGFLATIMDVGQMLGPVVTGMVLAAFGYSGSFFSLGVILLGVSVFFSIFQKQTTPSKNRNGGFSAQRLNIEGSSLCKDN